MVKKKRMRNKITPGLKQQILTVLGKEGCKIRSLAKEYDISIKTLYTWRRGIKLVNKQLESSVEDMGKLANNFIELSLAEEKRIKTIDAPLALSLQKAELVFNNFSFCVAGNFDSNLLIEILNVAGKHDQFRR